MDAVLAFLRENATEVLGFLTVILAAGGAGTLVLKRLMGERSPPQTPAPAPITAHADNQGISAVNMGGGTIDIKQSRAPLSDPVESARALDLPHRTIQEAVRRLQEKGVDDDALHESLAEFAFSWHQARERVDRLTAAGALDAATAAALDTALRTADLEAVDRLCRPPEDRRRYGASADRNAG